MCGEVRLYVLEYAQRWVGVVCVVMCGEIHLSQEVGVVCVVMCGEVHLSRESTHCAWRYICFKSQHFANVTCGEIHSSRKVDAVCVVMCGEIHLF